MLKRRTFGSKTTRSTSMCLGARRQCTYRHSIYSLWLALLLLVVSCWPSQGPYLSLAARQQALACSTEQARQCSSLGLVCVAGSCVAHVPPSSAEAAGAACVNSSVCRGRNPATPYCVKGQCAAKCTAHSQCDGPHAKLCAVDGVCRRQQCTNHQQCRGFNQDTPYCTAGRCRTFQCAIDKHCTSAAPYCVQSRCRRQQCYQNSHCVEKMGAGYACSVGRCQLAQQACTQDAECNPSQQSYCFNKTCQPQQCTSDTDCKRINNGTAPFCMLTNNIRVCQSCSTDEQCRRWSPAVPFCRNINGQRQCVGCADDTDCSVNQDLTGMACDTNRKICVECTSNEHCDQLAVVPGELTCSESKCVIKAEAVGNATVACQKAEQCPRYLYGPVQTCQIEAGSTDGYCRECNTDTDCPPGLNGAQSVCSSTGRCIQCRQDSDCPGDFLQPAVCSVATNKCVECRSDEHCRNAVSPGKALICVHGRCNYCRTDSDCCGTAGLAGLGPYCTTDGICATKGRPCATDDECVYDRNERCKCRTEPCPTPRCNMAEGVCDSGLVGL